MEEYRIRVLARPLLAMAALAALASGATNPSAVSLTVSPTMAVMQADTARQFTATVQNAANPAVRWFINDVEGGNATLGTISATGLYRAPTHSLQVLLRVRAVSVADPSVSATASAYVWPVIVVISPDRGVLAPGGRLQFGVTVFNHSNKQVTWFVNDVAGGNAAVGTINAAGLYEAPAGLTAPLTARIKAVSAVDRLAAGEATVNVTPAAAISVDVRPSSVSVRAGDSRQFSATVNRSSNQRVVWYVNDTPGGDAVVGTVTAAGLYRAPARVPNPAVVMVKAVSVADNNAMDRASVTILPPPEITVNVRPRLATVRTGASRDFSADVDNAANDRVSWFVNNVAGGNATVGTINASGLYTAPASLPNPPTVTVKAVSVADTSKFDTAAVVITTATVNVTPATASVQTGATREFDANTPVNWFVNDVAGGNATVGTINASGLYTAPAAVPSPAVVMVKGVSKADSTKFDTAAVTITAATVNVTPATASVQTGATKQFSSNTPVNWFVNDVAGGNATLGTINAAGLYTAPAAVPSPAVVTVKGVSKADPSKFDTAAVTIAAGLTVTVTPDTASVPTGTTKQFSSNTPVNWFVNDVAGGNATLGTINAAGLYTAPAAVPSPAVVTVKGVSTTDATKFDTSTVTITAAITVTVTPDTASVPTGTTKQFSSNTPVNWFVNDVAGGNATVGTINAAGLYTAPAAVPSPAAVTVKGVSTTDATKSATATVTITAAITVTVTPDTASVPTGTTKQFASNTPVNWFVNDVAGGNATLGTINAAGLYTAPAAVPSPAAVTVKGVSTTDTTKSATAAVTITAAPAITLTLTPETGSANTGSTLQFTAAVANSPNTQVSWLVNDIAGGNATLGTISTAGLYTAPATVPSPATVIVKAVSAADTSVSDTSTVTIQSGTSTGPSVTPTVVQPGAVTFTVRGTGFVPSTTAKFAGVDAPVTVISPTELRVTATTPTGKLGDMALIVRNPLPAPAIFPFRIEVRSYTGSPRLSYADAHRFLRKATFGPTPETVDRLQAIGIDAWLTEQFAGSTPDAYPTALEAEGSLEPLQERFMRLAITAPEQLRLKMAWVLSQIFVVSGVEITRADEMVPYQRMLYTSAFENFATTLRSVTLNAAMGEYLDNVNNGKGDPARGSVPNENFAREVMQLFTLGVNKLQPNGAPILNSSGMPDPTYNQDIVIALSRAFTGWTFTDGRAGAPVDWQPENYSGPMEAVERYHDTGEKILMNGFRIPAGQTAEQDLTMALDHLFRHPNVGPFIGRLLIQHFVTSNPSGAYIERVANVFSNNGAGVRGDMRAVLRQVLTDPEATGAPGPEFGRLREPVALMAAQLRPLRPVISDYPFTTDLAADMGQRIFFSPSVFNYFSANFRPAGVPLFAPEFQLFNTATALQRANFSSSLVLGNFSGSVQLDYSPFIDGAEDPALLVELIDRAYLGGTASVSVKTAVTDAVRQILATNPDMRTRLALYLLLSSTQFQVER